MRLAIATRSMNDFLYRASGQLLGLPKLMNGSGSACKRHRLTDTDSLGYFRELLKLDADWVINLDEDAFVLDPTRLLDLVRALEQCGYAACGMPDGGVVPIRRHNPVACNAYFNVFDLRRVRAVWGDWDRVKAATHKPEYESLVADFARRSTWAFDHFERYYGVFFSLLDAGERILYLDAEEWQDGVSTMLKGSAGEPLLIHCWYTRHWDKSYHTRQRCRAVLNHARQAQGLGPDPWDGAEPANRVNVPLESNAGKWDSVYRNSPEPQPFGDPLTYEKAARFLGNLATVEDWGCGWAWFRRYLNDFIRYTGIDGSASPFADRVADLTQYTSEVEGILVRHVLEHNVAWAEILDNALRSFTKRMVLVLATPFADVTHVVRYDRAVGVPVIAFAKTDLVRRFAGLRWTLDENLRTDTQHGVEHVFYLEKP
jgi:hypothetical protein